MISIFLLIVTFTGLGVYFMTNIVYTAGTWDLFHRGHVNLLKKSKQLGNVIVAVSTDELIEQIKGERPIYTLEDRLEILKSCKYVDKVIIQHKILDVEQMKEHKANIITIGDDWVNRNNEGLEWMKKHGKVIYYPYTKHVSTSKIKEKIRGE